MTPRSSLDHETRAQEMASMLRHVCDLDNLTMRVIAYVRGGASDDEIKQHDKQAVSYAKYRRLVQRHSQAAE